MQKCISIKIVGHVQNVGFRHYTKLAAKDFNIKGLVRNESDGSVYIEAEGDATDLEQFIQFCNRGSAWARVDEVHIQEIPPANFLHFVHA